jgi:hypothetical protein
MDAKNAEMGSHRACHVFDAVEECHPGKAGSPASAAVEVA